MPDVNEIAANSLIGIVLIIIFIGTFLLTLITFIDRRRYRTIKDANLCQVHTDRISDLEKDLAEVKNDIKSGFRGMKTDMTSIHTRIDDLFKILPNSNNHSRK